MLSVSDIANLISMRNFLHTSMDNLSVRIAKEDKSRISARIALLDKIIIENSLNIDLLNLSKKPEPDQTKTTFTTTISAVSSEDTETVMNRLKESEKNIKSDT